MIHNKNSESGFTLLEMAIIVIISGMVLSFLGATLVTFMHEGNIKTTEYRLKAIQDELAHYLSINGRYPCAANRTLGSNSASFGKEDLADCDAPGPLLAGTVRSAGVRIGAVPTRSLNLPDAFAADAWGRKFTYAVTEVLATNQKYRSDAGGITIQGPLPAITDAHYVVVSHGASGDGGFPIMGSTLRAIPCSPSANPSLDRENCDDSNAIFRAALVNSDSNLANFFDDYVYFKNSSAPLELPTGVVVPFDSATCPVGWMNYTRAEGRLIIGAQPNVLTRDQFTLRLATPSSKTLTLSTGTMDEGVDPPLQQAGAIIPPYLALRYCEKLPL